MFLGVCIGTMSCGKPESVVIGHMEHRNVRVTIKSSGDGILYSAKDKEGTVLFEDLTAEQLKRRSPAIYELIDQGNAGSADLIRPGLIRPNAPIETSPASR
jgi:secreted PhoX family phosphatase